jgi:glycosyltransferase involved in cell wall biosynthesis
LNLKNSAQCDKRILLVSSSPFPYGSGANSNFLTNFAVGLKKNNYDIELLIQYKLENGIRNFQEIKYSGCGGYEHKIKIIDSVRSLLSNIFSPTFYLVKNKKPINCVITFQNDFIETVFLLIACKILSIPYIHIQVDFYDWETFSQNKGGIKKKIRYANYTLRHNFLSRFYDGAIVLSSFLKNHYISKGLSEEDVLLQPHLVDVENFKDARITPIFQNEITYFGVLGSLNHQNGITDLMIAFQELVKKKYKAELLLIGGSVDDYKYCRTKAKELDIQAKIRYFDKVPYTELAGIMKQCDAFILARPASTEGIAGFPTKIGEFLSSKRPMIVTKYGDIPIYFKDEVNALLANPSDPSSLASKMMYLIDNKEKAIKMAENGYKWVIDNIEYITSGKKIVVFLSRFIKS